MIELFVYFTEVPPLESFCKGKPTGPRNQYNVDLLQVNAGLTGTDPTRVYFLFVTDLVYGIITSPGCSIFINGRHLIKPEYEAHNNVDERVRRKLETMVRHEWTPAESRVYVDKMFRQFFEKTYLQGILSLARERYDRRMTVFDSAYRGEYQRQVNLLSKDISAVKGGIIPGVARKTALDYATKLSAPYAVSYDSVYRYFYDSLAAAYRHRREAELRQRAVPDEILLAAASARLTELIPVISQDLPRTDRHWFSHNAARWPC